MRTRAPRQKVAEFQRAALPLLNDIVADSGDLLAHLQLAEQAEPGTQFEQHMQRARAIRKLAQAIQDDLRNLVRALASEERIHAEQPTE